MSTVHSKDEDSGPMKVGWTVDDWAGRTDELTVGTMVVRMADMRVVQMAERLAATTAFHWAEN